MLYGEGWDTDLIASHIGMASDAVLVDCLGTISGRYGVDQVVDQLADRCQHGDNVDTKRRYPGPRTQLSPSLIRPTDLYMLRGLIT